MKINIFSLFFCIWISLFLFTVVFVTKLGVTLDYYGGSKAGKVQTPSLSNLSHLGEYVKKNHWECYTNRE